MTLNAKELMERFGTDVLEDIKAKRNLEEETVKSLTNDVEVSKAISSNEFKSKLKELGIPYRKELEERQATFIISTEDVDRDGDVIKSDGIDFSEYNQNPIVLFAHDSSKLPIGVTLKVFKNNKQTKATVMFYDNEIDKTGTSDTIYSFVKANGIKGASIGFRAVKAKYPSPEEAKTYKMPDYGILYEKISVYEWSVVTIPANQNALRSKGLDVDKMKSLGLVEVESEEPVTLVSLEEVEILKSDIKEIKETLNTVMKLLNDEIKKKSVPVIECSEEADESFKIFVKELENTINKIKN